MNQKIVNVDIVKALNESTENNKKDTVHTIDFNVEWDCDDEECDLDNSFTADVDFEGIDVDNEEEVSEFLSEWLSDTYGFAHKNFRYHFSRPWRTICEIFKILKSKGFTNRLYQKDNLLEFRGSIMNSKNEKCDSEGTFEVMKDGIVSYSIVMTIDGKKIGETCGSFGNYGSLEDAIVGIIAPEHENLN